MDSSTSNDGRSRWAVKYNYREAPSINSCEICAYAMEVDVDGLWGVEALICSAGTDDTGVEFNVKFTTICDLYEPDLLENKPDDV